LRENFISALKGTNIPDVSEVLEFEEMVDEMIEKLINEPTIHSTSFTDYL
jgi:hypothetical protein